MDLTERFLKYVSFPTASDEESELTPSTPRQLALAEYLADELSGLGLEVKFDRASGCVYGYLPGTGGADEEWTPVNISSNATQGHALEANFGPGNFGGWSDVAVSNWLYNLFKAERCTDGRLDPRLYWTILSYEAEYNTYTGVATAAYPNGDPRKNEAYQVVITDANKGLLRTNNDNGGIPVAKWTNARTGLYGSVVTGLHCGINIRLMRYADVLLRAAECENEVNGPTQQAIDWINQVRSRANLNDLKLSDFSSKDALFEQIANVERPTEFGCEHGRFHDIIRWGWLYQADRLAQLRKHACTYWDDEAKVGLLPQTVEEANDDPFSFWKPGHEYLPIYDVYMNANSNLRGNSANKSESNESFYNGYTIHPVVSGIGVQ